MDTCLHCIALTMTRDVEVGGTMFSTDTTFCPSHFQLTTGRITDTELTDTQTDLLLLFAFEIIKSMLHSCKGLGQGHTGGNWHGCASLWRARACLLVFSLCKSSSWRWPPFP